MHRAKKSLLNFLIMALALGWQLQARAQTDSLSKVPAQFFQQLSTILLKAPTVADQNNAKSLLLRLDANRESGRFNSGIQNTIRDFVINMQTKRLHTYPLLYGYLFSLNILGDSHLETADMLAWQHFALALISGKQLKPFFDFMKFTRNLLEKQLLYHKANTAWYCRNGLFHMSYDTVFSLKFQHLQLVKASTSDSSIILNTKGTFLYQQKQWSGNGGLFYWSRFNKSKTGMYASLGAYQFNLSDNIIKIDTVTLKDAAFLKNELVGSIIDKVFSAKTNANTPYPRFISNANDLEINNIYPEIKFKGAIEVKGMQVLGVTKSGVKPEFDFQYKQKTVLKLKSDRFKIDADKLESAHVQVVILLKTDSIVHPNLQMRYTVPNKQLVLYSMASGGTQIPFFDTYHQMDLYVPSLFWNMNTDSLVFKKIRGINSDLTARFESTRFFSNKEFYSLQGIDALNPLYVIQNFTKTYSTSRISAAALSGYMQKPIDQVIGMLINLSNKGFIVYNAETQTAIVKKRLSYFLDAKARRSDFDVIHFSSEESRKANATLNLNNFSLNIYGVPRIFISDSQHVYIYPYKKKITVHKNRDFSFNGKVSAGLFNFYARNCTFVYDSFMINLNHIDSLTFSVLQKTSIKNRKVLIPVKNSLQKLIGRLYVDLPFNKSGLMHTPKYPIFVSKGECYVYFNRRSIQDSTLSPNRFYYRIDPFTFDSLMTFKTNGLAFQGQLISDSIFPSIHYPIRVMPDYSLGFVYKSPKDGLSMFSGLGTFSYIISLSNRGFRGNGLLTYLTTTSHSSQFVFYPDSVKAERAFNFKGRVDSTRYDFPSIHNDSISLDWDIPTNSMKLRGLNQKAFELYGNAYLKGMLTLNPKAMQGKGVFLFDRSEISSSNIHFKHNELSADSADFMLKNQSRSETTFLATNYFAKINFSTHRSKFTQLDQYSFVKFPQNQYLATMGRVEWKMNENKLILSSTHRKPENNIDSLSRKDSLNYHDSGSMFMALAPGQDSLRFYAEKAFYNMDQSTIDVEGVKVLKIADAAIFPKNETVKILQRGNLAPLVRASILTDTVNQYHKIYNATLNIQSRKSFTGSGTIDYHDINATAQPIQMKKIFVRNGKTIAKGTIARDEVFFLSPEYFYAGKVIMHSDHQFLRFNGGYQLNEGCVDNVNNWVAFNQELNPKHIAFHLSRSAHTSDSLAAYIGLAYSTSNYDFYPLIFQSKKKRADEILLSATGDLSFDPQTAAYRLGSPARLKNNNLKDNYIQLDTKKCVLSGDGILNMDLNTHLFKMKAIGNFKHYIVPDSTSLDVVLMLNFYFNKQALALMADSIRFFTVKSINNSKGLYPLAIKKLVSKQTSNRLLNELSLYGQIKKLPPELKSSITFTDLHLFWDKTTHSFISHGPIGVGSLGNAPINKYVNGVVQIEKIPDGSRIHFLLQEGRQWYFFTYANGVLQVLSSDDYFNSSIKNQKEEKRILNPNSLTDHYKYILATPQKSVNFIRNMKSLGRLK